MQSTGASREWGKEIKMSKHFQVEANGTIFGVYVADDEQAARDACAVDAGYASEADMADRLSQPSDLVATEVTITYFVTHGLGRAATSTADADAICDAVNASTAGSGDSISRDAVQAELDAYASAEVQELYRLTVESTTMEIEE